MAFRKICPSTSYPAQLSPELAVSSSCPPQDEADAETSRPFSVKRRRAPHTVTKNACLNCKKARAKCDGNEPCKRCASRTEAFQCVYETHVKYAKEELVRKVNQLQEQIKKLKEEDHLAKQILLALSADEEVPEILDRLQNGHAYKSIVEWLDQPLRTDSETPPPIKSQYSTSEDSDHEMRSPEPTHGMWTSVTSDSATIDHLLQLYFKFVHPVHTLVNKDRFYESYTRYAKSFCSSILVNAMCAMACHLNLRRDGIEADFEELGLKFSDSVRLEIDALDRSVTAIQSFGVMFLVDLFRSNALRAASYLNTASNILTRVEILETAGFREVLYDTIRGLHNLNVEWAQMTFQVPPAINLTFLPGIGSLDELAESKAEFYLFNSDLSSEIPDLVVTAILQKSKLIDIIDDVVTMMYNQHGSQITAIQVLQQLDRFAAWHDGLLAAIADVAGENGPAYSHVLSLLILYSNSVVQLLRPLLDLEGFPVELVEDTIRNHAQQGLFFLEEHYQLGYTSQYQPTLQMFATLHLIDVVARFFPRAVGRSGELGLEAVQFGCRILIESRDKYPVAGPLYEMLQRTASECGVSLPESLNGSRTANPRDNDIFREDDLIDACTRYTYLQPVYEIHKRYSSSFCGDWIAYGATPGFQLINSLDNGMRLIEERGTRSVMEIHNLLNMD